MTSPSPSSGYRLSSGNSPTGKIILASASPRRSEILRAAGISFEVLAATIQEQQRKGEPASKFVARMAAEKAEAALARLPKSSRLPKHFPVAILGADTVVVLGRRTLGKPASLEEARRMLRLLSGKKHRVLTGVCLLWPSLQGVSQRAAREAAARPAKKPAQVKAVRVVATTVKFRRLSEQEMERYIATGEPVGKAGAYAIQGGASKFVEWVHGCYFNVVGLPVSMVYQMLEERANAERTRARGSRQRKRQQSVETLLR